MTRVYLAGPMTGQPNYNAETFAAAAVLAREHGWEPINPHATDPSHDGPCPSGERHRGHPNACWYHAGLRALAGCDAVLMLPGWENSTGASLEHRYARWMGLPVHYINEVTR